MNLHFIVTAKEGEAIAALPAGTRQQLGAALLDAIELHEQLLQHDPRRSVRRRPSGARVAQAARGHGVSTPARPE
jgi:hypothetical protein